MSVLFLILLLFLFIYCSQYLQDRRAELHQIFQEDGKWAAIEKFSCWFLNSFGGGREVQMVTYAFLTQFRKTQRGGKTGLPIIKRSRLILYTTLFAKIGSRIKTEERKTLTNN